ncbi:MAG: outer membrane lipoprotein chaperone LolA [Gammaproteobacteria bacterium]
MLLASIAMPAMAADTSAPHLEHFLATVKTFEATFRQRVTVPGGEVIEDSTGTVVMQRPGHFRWNYTAPFERVIVADGKKVWLYEADLDQVTVRKLTSGLGDTPAALLTGKESVLARFNVEKSWTAKGMDWLRLTPRSAEADFAAVTLGFKDDTLRQILLDDRLAQQTRIDFNDVKINRSLPADVFRFTIPAGADVIDDSDL